MERRDSEARTKSRKVLDTGGPPCEEAQADGVPCEEIGADCEDCDRADEQSRVVYKTRTDRG
jgi:hypothetical protein